jgi:hypothetical protein
MEEENGRKRNRQIAGEYESQRKEIEITTKTCLELSIAEITQL